MPKRKRRTYEDLERIALSNPEIKEYLDEQEKLRTGEIRATDIFAPREELQNLGVSVDHFVDNVILPFLDAPWVMMTDRSSIYDFCGGAEGKEELLELIEQVYGVNVSPVENGIVADVIKYIESKKKF